MKLNHFMGLIVVLWIVLVVKTILAVYAVDESPTMLFYSGIMKNDWQAQFNLDLLCLTIVFAIWIFYRDTSKIRGSIFAALNVYLGGIFTLAYMAVALYRSNNDLHIFLNGKKSRIQHTSHIDKTLKETA